MKLNKKYLNLVVITTMLILGGCSSNNNLSDSNVSQQDNNQCILGTLSEDEVMNGSNTEILGTRLEVASSENLITKESLINFYNDTVVSNSPDYTYITVRLENDMGILFSTSGPLFIYGNIDETGSMAKGLGDGIISDNGIKYTERSLQE